MERDGKRDVVVGQSNGSCEPLGLTVCMEVNRRREALIKGDPQDRSRYDINFTVDISVVSSQNL